MHLIRFGAIALMVMAVRPAVAQSDSADKPTRVLSHTFTTPSREFVRVRLISAESYRVQVSRAQAKLEIRAVSPGVQPPVVRPLFTGDKLAVFLVQPRVSAEYEIRILSGGTRPLLLTIDRRPGKP